MDVIKKNYPVGVGNLKHGTGFQNRSPVAWCNGAYMMKKKAVIDL